LRTKVYSDLGRCTSTGRQCDGYVRLASSNSQAVAPSQPPTLRGTVPVLSEFGDSVLYLEFYHHCAGPTLASNFDHEFWSRTVLQMAHQESSVRHAVIALGYLVKTEPGSLKHARSDSTADNRKTLLLHYNKAVRCLVDRMAQSSYSPEIALVTCLLFICIEHLRGDYHAAFAHLHSGLKIIAEWQQRTRDYFQSSPISSSSSESLSSSVVIAKKVDGPRLITDNLIPMFTRAITAALLMGAPFEPRLKGFCPHPQTLQEQSFTSVLDAQSALHDLRNATLLVVSILFRTLIIGKQPAKGDLYDRAHLLRCHDSWFRALQILEREEKLSSEDSVVASSLKVSYYVTYMALARATDVNQPFGGTSFDSDISSFQAVNYHAKIVIDSMDLPISSPSISQATPSSSSSSSSSISGHKQAAAHFSFEISLIPSVVSKLEAHKVERAQLTINTPDELYFSFPPSLEHLADHVFILSLSSLADVAALLLGVKRFISLKETRHEKPLGTLSCMRWSQGASSRLKRVKLIRKQGGQHLVLVSWLLTFRTWRRMAGFGSSL